MRLRGTYLLLSVVGLATLPGCASTIAAIQNDPARVHTLRPDRFFTLAGNSRLAFQVERYDPKHPRSLIHDKKSGRDYGRMAWCAESLPEVAQAVSATSKPTVKLSNSATTSTEDSFGTTLTQTFTRTEIAEIYRQMGWQACQAWAQGVLDDDQYRAQLDAILKVGSEIIKTRAKQPLNSPAKAEAPLTGTTGKTGADASGKSNSAKQ